MARLSAITILTPSGSPRADREGETQMIREAITWAIMCAIAIGLIMVGFDL
jgi:hypothetical protein